MGMPVSTPMRKLIPKILAQKRAAWLYVSSPVRSAKLFRITMSGARPMVSWGKR